MRAAHGCRDLGLLERSVVAGSFLRLDPFDSGLDRIGRCLGAGCLSACGPWTARETLSLAARFIALQSGIASFVAMTGVVATFGAGIELFSGVGLAAVLGALACGASPVIAVDLNPDKLALAATLGAVHTINAADPDAIEQVKALTGGGADFAFEVAGSARALEAAWKMTRRGGTTVTAGLPPPEAALAVNIVSLVAEERTLKGSYIGTCVPSRDIPRFIRLFKDGRLPVDRLLSGTLTLDQINPAFDALADGMAVRQIIRF